MEGEGEGGEGRREGVTHWFSSLTKDNQLPSKFTQHYLKNVKKTFK